MQVIGADTRMSRRGAGEWFTGAVWIDEIATCPRRPA